MLREQFEGLHPPHIFAPPVSVAHLESLPYDGHRYEVIDGEIHVEEFPLIAHQLTIRNMLFALSLHLIKANTGIALSSVGVILDEQTCVIPDAIFVSHERLAEILAQDDLLHGTPELIIEVISPSRVNELRDRFIKHDLYSRHGTTEFWLVDSIHNMVEVYRRTDARLHLHATLMESDNLTTPLLPDFSCAVSKIFAR